MKISYDWLKAYVPDIPEFEKLGQVFSQHLCEVESMDLDHEFGTKNVIFDLNILPNRAHDLLSHQGIARELCGQLGKTFTDPTPMYKVPASKPTQLEIKIETEKCRRYMGRIVRGVKVGPSPEWVVKHLESIGQSSVNNIVDATNICMFDCGQPMHAFDLKKIKNEKIIIKAGDRRLKENELQEPLDKHPFSYIRLLNNKDYFIDNTDLIISDETKTLALAGVMGGLDSGVQPDTTDIVLEVANFDPVTVRKTARRLGIFTDSAKRFENDLSPELSDFAMMEISALIVEMCPDATFEDIVDVYPNPQAKRTLSFSLDTINGKLGSNISLEEAETILKNYTYSYKKEGSNFTIDVPPLRLDLTGAHDMAEEIGRIYGYEKITPVLPKINFAPKVNETYARMRVARAKLLADGYSEVMTYTFVKKGKVEVARGAKGKEFLRTNLADGLKDSYEMNRLNAPLLGESEIKIFEIGTVFPSADLQEMHVAYADKKGAVEATLEEFTRDIPLDVPPKNGHNDSKPFSPWSAYPFITRDVAVWVPAGTEAFELIELCKKNGGELLVREPQLFDQFTKGDKMSLAVRMVFQSMDRTLTDVEVMDVMARIATAIEEKGWEIR